MTTNLVLDARQRAMLAEMGVRVWMPLLEAKQNKASQPIAETAQASVATSVPASLPVRREPPLRLPVLSQPPVQMAGVPTRYVIGNLQDATDHVTSSFDWVLLGEPCTGDAEKLLTNILRLLGGHGFVAQMVPAPQDQSNDLQNQLIATDLLAQAKLIVALGPHSAKALLGGAAQAVPFGKLRGQTHLADGLSAKIFVTYHPLQLLRQPLAKAQAWLDLKRIMKALA